MYIIYYLIVYYKYLQGEFVDKPLQSLDFVCWLILARFIAFIGEEMVDIAIDAELHNDLTKLQALKIQGKGSKKVKTKSKTKNKTKTKKAREKHFIINFSKQSNSTDIEYFGMETNTSLSRSEESFRAKAALFLTGKML